MSYAPAPQVKLSSELTAETPYPDIPEKLTWGQSLTLNSELLTALGQCNADKAGIRNFESSRQNIK